MRERDVLRQLAEQQREITSLRRALERALRYVPHGEERQRMLELACRGPESDVLCLSFDRGTYPVGEEE